jgi:hypothetical protein
VATKAARRDEASPRPASARKSEAATSEGESQDSPAEKPEREPITAPGGESALAQAIRGDDAPKPAPAAAASDAPEFNREAASQALGDAALRASGCRALGGPTGSGQATVTFSPSGKVSAANVGGDFAGSSVGACIAKLFRAVAVPAFSGDPVTVSKRFNVE